LEEILRVEAEAGVLAGGAKVATSRGGFSGTGYVTNFLQEGDELNLEALITEPGVYELRLGYASPYSEKRALVDVNGGNGIYAVLPQARTFRETSLGNHRLVAGKNQIRILKDWGYYDVDYIAVAPSPAPGEYFAEDDLVTPDASAETRAVFCYLLSIYGKKTLTGQQDPHRHSEFLATLTGQSPALGAFDFIWKSPAGPAEQRKSIDNTADMIRWANEKKGIVSASWHWFSPLGGKLNDQGDPDGTFYSDKTTFDVRKALEAGTPEHTVLLRDIDAIAVELKRLQAAKVPLLFRPLHEAEGRWFWWGEHGPKPAKELWRLLFDRYTRHHGLNNLIWVWNSGSPDWYPGADVVDVISVDIYNPGFSYNPNSKRFQDLVTLGENRKLVALGENGPIPDPSEIVDYDARWLWFNTWVGEFILEEKYSSYDSVKAAYNHEATVTLDELPDVYHFAP
jgi:mannan endo-1,4-beta-mannosidase